MDDSKTTLYCSFCGKSQHEIRKLIAGPASFICNECVELCMDICDDEKKQAGGQDLTSEEISRLENRELRSLLDQSLSVLNQEVLRRKRELSPMEKIADEIRTVLNAPVTNPTGNVTPGLVSFSTPK